MSRHDQAITLFAAEDLENASRVSPHVQIQRVRLLGCHCQHRPDAAPDHAAAVRLQADAEAAIERKVRRLTVIASFALATDPEQTDVEPFVRIEARFLLEYTLDRVQGITQDHAQAFARTNGIYNAWPYWREFVQSMLARMELPPLTMPVLRPEAGTAAQKRARGARSRGKTARH